jgi:hypothetical protein
VANRVKDRHFFYSSVFVHCIYHYCCTSIKLLARLIAFVVRRLDSKLISFIAVVHTLTYNLYLFSSHEDERLRGFVCAILKLHRCTASAIEN